MTDTTGSNPTLLDLQTIDSSLPCADAVIGPVVDPVIGPVVGPVMGSGCSSQPDADAAPLTFLTNPLYHHVFKQTLKTQQHSIAVDLKFYRKRILALTKELAKGHGDAADATMQNIYTTYALHLVNHFKVLDKKDIVQNQYPAADQDQGQDQVQGQDQDQDQDQNDLGQAKQFCLAEVNASLLKKVTTMPTLDNYVTSVDTSNPDSKFIPLHLEIDLKAPALKTKGLRVKAKKDIKDIKDIKAKKK